MIDNPYLDTVISLVLVYASLSIVVSMAVEWLNKGLGTRGTFLKSAIERMINDPNNYEFGHMIYAHPVIARLRKDAKTLPSYISSSAFATALIDLLGERGWSMTSKAVDNGLFQFVRTTPMESLDIRFRQGLASLEESQMKSFLLGLADRCVATSGAVFLEALRKEIANWYDDHMDRVTGEYKDTQRMKFYVFGFAVAIALNVDSIHLARVFFLNEPLRTSMVQRAEEAADRYALSPDTLKHNIDYLRSIVVALPTDSSVGDSVKVPKGLKKSLQVLLGKAKGELAASRTDSVLAAISQWGLPIGYADDEPPVIWCKKKDKKNKVVQQKLALLRTDPLLHYFDERAKHPLLYGFLWLVGISLSGLALSAGAPFWFEAMVKLINIRRAGVKPQPMREEHTT